jgi:hypothetical protein
MLVSCSKFYQHFVELQGSTACSQEPAAGSYSETNEPVPCTPSYFSKIPIQTYIVTVIIAIPVTGRRWPYGCDTSTFPHFLDTRLTDGDEVSLTRRPPFTPRNITGTHFCWRLSLAHSHSAIRKIKSIEKSNDLIGNWTHKLSASSIVPQPTTLPRALSYSYKHQNFR